MRGIGQRVRGAMGAAALSLCLGTGGAWAETLADALVGAYKSSDLLTQQQALLRAADENVATAVSALRPIISYSLSHTYNTATSALTGSRAYTNTTQGAISLDWLLTDFGASKLGVEAQKEVVLATRASLVGIEQQVLINAVSAYLSYRDALEEVALRQSNVRLIGQELRAANDRFEVGEVTRTDVALAQSAEAQARSGLVAAQGALAVAREAYIVAIGRAPGQLAAATRPRLPARSLLDAQALAVRTHPDILRTQHSIRAAELSLEQRKAALKPSLRLSSSVADTSASDYSASIGVQLSGPIYAGGALESAIRAQKARVEAERSTLNLTLLTVRQNVAISWSNVQVARAQIGAAQEQVRAARTAFNGLREEASLGARTTLEVLDAEQDLLNAQVALLTAETSEQLALYSLLSAMGYLTADYLNLGVPAYDPTVYYEAVKSAPTQTLQGKKLDRVLKALGKN